MVYIMYSSVVFIGLGSLKIIGKLHAVQLHSHYFLKS